MRTQFFTLFDQHIGTAFARQLLFSKLLHVKEEPTINLQEGHVLFSNGQQYAIDILGTQLEDGTFLWAWAEENQHIFPNPAFKAPFPSQCLAAALQLKQWAEQNHAELLHHPKIVLELSAIPLVPDELNGDHIACLAAGLQNKAYWRDTHDEGVIYYLIQNTPDEANTPFTAPHILESIEQITSYFQADNKIMVESFLQQQGFTISWETKVNKEEKKPTLCQAHRGTEHISATFDDDGFLTEIEAHGFEGEGEYQEEQDLDFENIFDSWDEDSEFEDSEFPPKIKP